MTKDLNKAELITFFIWGVIGLLCVQLLVYIIFLSVSVQYATDSQYNVWAVSWKHGYQFMAFGILYYCVGFAFRGKERKSISINLAKMSTDEKDMLIEIIKRSKKDGEK